MAANLSLPSVWYSKKGRKRHSEHICKSWTFSCCVSCIFNITPLPARPRRCFNIHCSIRAWVLVPTNLIQDQGNLPSLFGPRIRTLSRKQKCEVMVCSALIPHCPPLPPYLHLDIHDPPPKRKTGFVYIWKDPDAGKDWRREEKGTSEDEMVGWHHRLDGHEFE